MTANATFAAAAPASSSDAAPTIRRLTIYRDAYDYWHDRYQVYFREGLSRLTAEQGGEVVTESLFGPIRAMELVRRLKHSSKVEQLAGRYTKSLQASLDRMTSACYRRRLPPSGVFDPLVGQYLIETNDGARIKVCIDARDATTLGDAALVDWSDVYFKTNYALSRTYPEKVQPLYVCSSLVLPHLSKLRQLRSAEPKVDLSFIVRVWGGANEEEGVEHNVRLLEAVAKVRCEKTVVAYLVTADAARLAKRLEQSGVVCITRPYPLSELWDISARSRLTVIRLGMHYCVPWRMHDLLAMGACPVLDQPPATRWLEPLQEGENFLQLDCAASDACPVATDAAYAEIAPRLEAFLQDRARCEHIRRQNVHYFDQRLQPVQVGRQILATAVRAGVAR